MPLVPGTLVDRYRVESEIGRGGMARVYRVRHKNLGTLHALKVLSVTSEDLRARLLQEGRLQARLDHPALLPVRDVLEVEGGPGLLMDFIDGPSLDAWLVQERPGPALRAEVFQAILEGVAFAHAAGVVHRDLKPGNVLVERRHGGWQPRVADFGLAKVLGGEDPDDAGLSRTGRPMGTPAYMAPEQVRSAKHVDHRADVFALGCILYELETGRRAFTGEDSLEVFNRVARGTFVPPRDLVPALAPALEAAILGAMEVDLAARIPNVETLAAVARGEQPWSPAPSSRASLTMDGSLGDVEAGPQSPTGSATMLPGLLDEVAPSLSTVLHERRPHVDPPPDRPAQPAPPVAAREGAVGPRSLPVGGVLGAAALVLALLAVGWSLGEDSRRTSEPATTTTPAPPPPAGVAGRASPAPPPVRPPSPTAQASAAGSDTPTGEALRRGEPPPPQATNLPAPQPSDTVAHPPASRGPVGASAPARGSVGTVRVSGDAQEVVLRGVDGTRRPPGEVPAGSYVLEARFDEGPPLHAGNVVVRPGVVHRVDCRAAMLGCNE